MSQFYTMHLSVGDFALVLEQGLCVYPAYASSRKNMAEMLADGPGESKMSPDFSFLVVEVDKVMPVDLQGKEVSKKLR